jgi:hypothetical protein
MKIEYNWSRLSSAGPQSTTRSADVIRTANFSPVPREHSGVRTDNSYEGREQGECRVNRMTYYDVTNESFIDIYRMSIVNRKTAEALRRMSGVLTYSFLTFLLFTTEFSFRYFVRS